MIDKQTNEKTISDYTFANKTLLTTALTHASYTNEIAERKRCCDDTANNERLEYLGDAVLELVVSEHIYSTYPELTEGQMTKLRASIVRESTLANVAHKLKLGTMMRMSRGEENTGGRNRDSILADCFEAIAGAIYVDSGSQGSEGLAEARRFILNNLSGHIKTLRENFMTMDYKTHLQEEVQSYSRDPLEYSVIKENGPAHNRTFEVRLVHRNVTLATSTGRTKKEAEQDCARKALECLHASTK